MEREPRPEGWIVTYPNKEWCIYERQNRGGSGAEWTADKDGVSCALHCNGYGGYSDSCGFSWALLAELVATQGYELKKKEP